VTLAFALTLSVLKLFATATVRPLI